MDAKDILGFAVPIFIFLLSLWNGLLMKQISSSHAHAEKANEKARDAEKVSNDLRIHVSETYVRRAEHTAAYQDLKAEIGKTNEKLDGLRDLLVQSAQRDK